MFLLGEAAWQRINQAQKLQRLEAQRTSLHNQFEHCICLLLLDSQADRLKPKYADNAAAIIINAPEAKNGNIAHPVDFTFTLALLMMPMVGS